MAAATIEPVFEQMRRELAVLAIIMAHAPVILPAVLRRPLPVSQYRKDL